MKINRLQICCVVFVCLPFALSLTFTSNGDASDFSVRDDGNARKKDLLDMFRWLLSGPARKETENLISRIRTILEENNKRGDDTDDDRFDSELVKRLKPSFNPTGWRRKREISADAQLAQILGNAYGYLNVAFPAQDDETNQWRKRTTNYGAFRNRKRYNNRSLKRKPLEFNPTGW